MPTANRHMPEVLQGQIERITYTNEENGYTIAKLKVYGRSDLVTVVGPLMAPTAGEILSLRGRWVTHPKYGEQFQVEAFEIKVPATVHGIQKYLGSGLIKGIGPVMAKRLVKRFGKETLEVIEGAPAKLLSVDGIGEKRVEMITAAWEEQKEIREVMLFLQSHGVSAGYAAKIFKQYGQRAVAVVTENPYRMAMDIFGIGFVTADGIARKLGFGEDAPVRIEAGILFVLHQLADSGHVYYPEEALVRQCREILGVEAPPVHRAMSAIKAEGRIVVEPFSEGDGPPSRGVYLAKFHLCETSIARRIRALQAAPKSILDADPERALAWLQGTLSIRLAQHQAAAIRAALTEKVMVITGGPGTGKTTIIDGILKIFSRMGVSIQLAAPTGRAAKRMSEATGREARTIHRLLEYSLQNGGFQRDDNNPLDCQLLVVDEASMIDTILMHHLLKAVPPGATLILVGDVHQLPSVGAGNVLKDLIASEAVPVVTLTEIFRQASQSRIVVNAHRINSGQMPELKSSRDDGDFFFIQEEDPETALQTIVDLANRRLPEWGGFDPVSDIQVLTPMHRGVVGAANLNIRLQEALNPGDGGLVRGSRRIRENDKVMQIRNNYDKEVYNGDMGRISRIDMELQAVTVSFDGRRVVYEFSELDDIVLAYAVSVHKSQGSEFPVVIVPVMIQHYMLLQRNLIYTAVTRGRQLVVLVGTRKALAIGIRNNNTEARHTRLQYRLGLSGGENFY
jgi:exodeoxyribonuclease V alpha subunit